MTAPVWLRLGGWVMLAMALSEPVYACMSIGGWNDLVDAVSNASDSLSLCSFDIDKPESERLVIDRRLTMTCAGGTSSSKCTIRGSGNHVRIVQSAAEVLLEGFVFVGATTCAVRIMSTSTKTQELRKCDFINNIGDSPMWRGGAIKTERDTSLIVSESQFVGNAAGGGGGIFHRGDYMATYDSSFRDNYAKQGGAIQVDEASVLEVHDTVFFNNTATRLHGGGIVLADATTLADSTGLFGKDNVPCNGVYDVASMACTEFIPRDVENPDPFVPGELSVKQEGLQLSTGLKIKVLARKGEPVELTSPGALGKESSIPFHAEPDGAAVFEQNDGGWVYMSNSEVRSNDGGVYGLEFDPQGRPRSYTQRLNSTSRNCAGGVTPWNTWVSCEEHANGQCWQVDPAGERPPAKTELVEQAGGNFESMAVDFRDPDRVRFFVTEDHERGALRRFTPCPQPLEWNMLHKKGIIEYLEFLPGNRFWWTPSLERGRASAFEFYKNVEGISHDDGVLSFVSKKQKEIFHLNLDAGTYTKGTTVAQDLARGGSFGASPDQLLLFSDVLYLTEDGGRTPGIYAHDGSHVYALVEGYASEYQTDETTGFAFSPDGTKLYFCIQDIGLLFQLERKDGRPFDYDRRLLSLRFHQGD